MYIKVKNNQIEGSPFYLSGTYTTDTGETICGIENWSDTEKATLGLYPVIDVTPEYDSRYFYKGIQTFVIVGKTVESSSELVANLPSIMLIEQRLTAFAREKDIDIQEVAMLLTSTNPVWQQEAHYFANLYDLTWQAYYAYTGESWQELEVSLPILTWI